MSDKEIEIAVQHTLIKLGVIPITIKRSEVVKTYSRRVWDNAAKDLNVFSDGKAYYMKRTDFNKWAHENLLK